MPILTSRSEGIQGRGRATERCAVRLRNAIVGGEFPPGLRLPPERELAERFEVNRVTVRSALARIEAEHLVTVRQGSGYVVRDFRRTGGPDLITTLSQLATSSTDRIEIMRDLLVVRRHLARATLERIIATLADDADPNALDRVDAAIDRFEAAIRAKAHVALLAQFDLEIVSELVAASKSTVLQLCFNPVAAILRESPVLQAAMYRDPLSNVAAFRGVLALVKQGRADLVDSLIGELARRDDATIDHLKSQTKKNKRKS